MCTRGIAEAKNKKKKKQNNGEKMRRYRRLFFAYFKLRRTQLNKKSTGETKYKEKFKNILIIDLFIKICIKKNRLVVFVAIFLLSRFVLKKNKQQKQTNKKAKQEKQKSREKTHLCRQ